MRSLVAIALLVVLAAVPGPVAASIERQPALGVVELRPLTIRGRDFTPSERVVVRVAKSGRAWTRRAVASERGAFSVRFTFGVARCERFTARASGSTGSLAVLPVRPRIDCGPET